MSRSLPARPSLDHLKDQAKDLLHAHQQGDPSVCTTLHELHRFARATNADILAAPVDLNDVQFALAIEYGFSSWTELKRFVEGVRQPAGAGEPEPSFGRIFSGELWGDLQAHHARYAAPQERQELLARLRAALAAGELVAAVNLLAYNEATLDAAKRLAALKDQPGWSKGIKESLEELAREMEREIALRRVVARPADLALMIRRTIEGLDFFRAGDVLEISVEENNPSVWVNYVSRDLSPAFEAAKGEWDRDTQYMFEMDFAAGLFCWLSVSTVPAFQGRGIGTRFLRATEELATGLGFKRFSVAGPNNGPYWERVMGYTVSRGPLVHNMEAYKEME